MSPTIQAALEPLFHSPCLPEISAALEARIRAEAARRQRFYDELTDDQKAEFIDGEVVVHPPARSGHTKARQHIEWLLNAFVQTHGCGVVLSEKCLCVFPRNDYEPDIVFFGPDKAARITPDTCLFPIPDLIVEVLSDSTERRDRGVKFEDFEAHGVAEYWIVDADAQCVEQYVRRGERLELALKSNSGVIASPTVAGLEVPIRALFDPAENFATLRRLLTV